MVQSEKIILELIRPTDQAINFVFGVYSNPKYNASYPDLERTFSAIYSLVKGWEAGIVSIWGAFIGDKIAVLFHGNLFNNYQYEIHQVVMSDFWGKKNWPLQIEAAEKMADTIFDEYPRLKQITGFTPMNNPLAIKFAERSGFNKVGEMPDYYDKGDETINAAIMVKRRSS